MGRNEEKDSDKLSHGMDFKLRASTVSFSPNGVLGDEREIVVRYVAKDWRRRFVIPPPQLVSEAIALCVQKFHCPDRNYEMLPHEQYGFYMPSKGTWVDSGPGCDLKQIPETEVLELQNRFDFIKLSFNKEDNGKFHYAEGWLSKRGHRTGVWKQRWFILKNKTLTYYKKKLRDFPDEPMAGEIDLGTPFEFGFVVSSIDEFQFHVTRPQRSYHLCAANAVDLSHWLRLLRHLQAELNEMEISDGSDDSAEEDVDAPYAAARAGLPTGDKAGYLLKRGKKTNTWKGRWFVLKDKVMEHYKGGTVRGFINLEGCQIYFYPPSIPKRLLTFKIVASHRSYFLKASDQHEFDDWSKAFEFIAAVPVQMKEETAPDVDDDDEDPPTLPKDEPSIIEGYLMKQGHNAIADWRRRYFILRGYTLYYQKSIESKHTLGSIPLMACTFSEDASAKTKKPFSFELVISNRHYYLNASSEEDKERWMSSLRPYLQLSHPS